MRRSRNFCTGSNNKEQQIEHYKKDISEKYQQYIDNYESIGRLVYESQVRSDNMIRAAEKKRDEILAEADTEAERRVLSVQTEVDEKLAEGKKKYIAVQDELNDIVELINQVQQGSHVLLQRSAPDHQQYAGKHAGDERGAGRGRGGSTGKTVRKRLRTALTRRTVMNWMRTLWPCSMKKTKNKGRAEEKEK